MDEFVVIDRSTGSVIQICLDGKQYDSEPRAICYLVATVGFTKDEAVSYIIALPTKYI